MSVPRYVALRTSSLPPPPCRPEAATHLRWSFSSSPPYPPHSDAPAAGESRRCRPPPSGKELPGPSEPERTQRYESRMRMPRSESRPRLHWPGYLHPKAMLSARRSSKAKFSCGGADHNQLKQKDCRERRSRVKGRGSRVEGRGSRVSHLVQLFDLDDVAEIQPALGNAAARMRLIVAQGEPRSPIGLRVRTKPKLAWSRPGAKAGVTYLDAGYFKPSTRSGAGEKRETIRKRQGA
eukprot:scaffold482_cov247-Pinguiococcus_pyrenoidosus.AAC.1